MTRAEAEAKKLALETELAALKAVKMRILTQGQSIQSQDGDANVQVNRASFPQVCNDIKRLEGQIAQLNEVIASPEARRRSINMRGV